MNNTIQTQSYINQAIDDKFLLFLNPPLGLRKYLTNKSNVSTSKIDFDSLQMTVMGHVLPDISVEGDKLPYGGGSIAVSRHIRPPYPDIETVFALNNQWLNYWVLIKWMDFMSDTQDSSFDGDSNQGKIPQYATNITLYALDEMEQKVAKFDYIGAFPVSLKQVPFRYSQSNKIFISCNWSYTRVEPSLI